MNKNIRHYEFSANKKESINSDKTNDKENDLKDIELYKIERRKQLIKNLKIDRKLKIHTLKFIVSIIKKIIYITFLIVIGNGIIKFISKSKITIYSEWFLSVLIGSQLVILPFSLLLIVTKHLFPNKDKLKTRNKK